MSFLPGIDTRICQSQTRISGVPKYLIFRAERNHAKGFNLPHVQLLIEYKVWEFNNQINHLSVSDNITQIGY